MKRKKVGVLASAIATSAVCASMVVGSTFALFTDEDTVNVAVTAANVKVNAWIDTYAVTAAEGVTGTNGAFSATKEGDVIKGLTLDNAAPGDKYSFVVKAENASSIAALCRTSIEFSNATLASAFNVSVGGTEYGAVKSYTTPWTKVEAGASVLGEDGLAVEITFVYSSESQNEYQGLKTDISVKVEAVQANAQGYEVGGTPVVENITLVKSADDLQAALAESELVVTNNALRFDEDVEIDLKGHTLEVAEAKAEMVIGENANVKFSNGTINFTGDFFGYYKDLYTKAYPNETEETITDWAKTNQVAKSTIIPLTDSTVTLEGCEITSAASIVYPQSKNATVNITNSKLSAQGYCVATNATVEKQVEKNAAGEWVYAPTVMKYGDHTFNLNNSTFDSAVGVPVYSNVPSTWNIEGCTATGATQGLFIRSGNVVAKDSTFVYTGTKEMILDGAAYFDKDKTQLKNWGNGSTGACAAVVVGMRGVWGNYLAANVTLENCTLVNDANLLAYAWANGNGATLKMTDCKKADETAIAFSDVNGGSDPVIRQGFKNPETGKWTVFANGAEGKLILTIDEEIKTFTNKQDLTTPDA